MLKNDIQERYDAHGEHEEKRGTVRGIKRKALAPCKKPPKLTPDAPPAQTVKFFEEVHNDDRDFARRVSDSNKHNNSVLRDSGRARGRGLVVTKRRRDEWTPANEYTLRAMRDGGADWETISAAIGRSPDACRVHYAKIAPKGVKWTAWKESEKAIVREMVKNGAPTRDICAAVGRSQSAVRKLIQRMKGKTK